MHTLYRLTNDAASVSDHVCYIDMRNARFALPRACHSSPLPRPPSRRFPAGPAQLRWISLVSNRCSLYLQLCTFSFAHCLKVDLASNVPLVCGSRGDLGSLNAVHLQIICKLSLTSWAGVRADSRHGGIAIVHCIKMHASAKRQVLSRSLRPGTSCCMPGCIAGRFPPQKPARAEEL